jgi:ribA/ribD-fused uncharacterized protein
MGVGLMGKQVMVTFTAKVIIDAEVAKHISIGTIPSNPIIDYELWKDIIVNLECTGLELVERVMSLFYFDNEINSFRGEYGWMSNFHKCDCWWEDKLYPSSEHLYQAFKATNDKDRELVRKHPFEGLKTFARHIKMRDDWDEVKYDMMTCALMSKFYNNRELRFKLIATGDIRIVEGNNWCDSYWGVCSCPKCDKIEGKNMLGVLLMDIREHFKSYYDG